MPLMTPEEQENARKVLHRQSIADEIKRLLCSGVLLTQQESEEIISLIRSRARLQPKP